MKNIIVRRVDELGRIVIPKQVRRELVITEGDPLTIEIKDGGIFMKLYISEIEETK